MNCQAVISILSIVCVVVKNALKEVSVSEFKQWSTHHTVHFLKQTAGGTVAFYLPICL